MLEFFYTNKFDDKVILFDGSKKYSVLDLKMLVFSEIQFIKNMTESVVILGGDNFSFVIQFLAALFCDKKIYLLSDKTRVNDLTINYDILEGYNESFYNDISFPKIDVNKLNINFFTSGSSGTPKIITKSLFNIINEADEINSLLKLKGKSFEVLSTTTMTHMFGMTFHFVMPLQLGLVINTKKIFYPENVDSENSILISTPTFLTSVPKFDIKFKRPPKYIFTAGSKLDENTFKFLESSSSVVEIYGSTETGIMAYKRSSNGNFKLFDNVELIKNDDSVIVKSQFFSEPYTVINDNVEIIDREIKINNRSDRLYKVYEKRVCANELEYRLKQSDLVNDCYILKSKEKLVCFAALSEKGKMFLLENSIVILTKKLKKYLADSSEIVPQRWKFTDEIPKNIAGKTDKDKIEYYFDLNCSMPIILDRKLSSDSITYKILFYRQSNFFKGHFSSFPIVPGVIQIYWAKEFVNSHFKTNVGEGQWKRIKFTNIIKPDDIVYLTLSKSDKSVRFEYWNNSKNYSSGVFLCDNIFEGVYSK